MGVLRCDRRTDGSAQDVLAAVDAFLGSRPLEVARLRVELVTPRRVALWRGSRIVALRYGDDLVWNTDMYVSPTLELQAEHGVRGVPTDADWFGATNPVLALLLVARWPYNFADHCGRQSRLARTYRSWSDSAGTQSSRRRETDERA